MCIKISSYPTHCLIFLLSDSWYSLLRTNSKFYAHKHARQKASWSAAAAFGL